VLPLDNLVANQNQTTSRIGQLFWYIIAETYTDQVTMAQAFMESGLPDRYKLPPIRAVDAYRRASKSIEGRATLDGDRRIELLVRDVWHNKDEVVRHLVVEIRDTSGHRLTYDSKAALLRFDHNYKTVDVEVVRDEAFIVDAVNTFRKNYELFLTTYDGAAKRRAVYAVLNDLSATALKESGGVYLIPRQNEELLFQLIAFINRLAGCKAYHLSVENTEEARDMVRDVVTNKAETILNEIRATLKADVVTEDTIQTLLERAKHIRQEVTLYQEILKESIGTLETDVDLLEQQMMSLIEKL
jgi:hypothetical protein